MQIGWRSVAVVTGLIFACWCGYRLGPRHLNPHPAALVPVWHRLDGNDTVQLRGRYLVAESGSYDDELFAFMMFQYLRDAAALRDSEVLLTYDDTGGRLFYSVQIHLQNNLLRSLFLLAQCHEAGLIGQYEWRYVTQDTLRKYRYQSQGFESAYKITSRRKLELARPELTRFVSRFVRFKSLTDPRIRKNIEPVPRPLSAGEANRLAADIVAVAEFYSLPLEFFLGIGAMENNFMDVNGDLGHAVWKARPMKGDIILCRRGNRVLVLDPAAGAWQITRETLRYAHRLYLRDTRDYSGLPDRLRPPRDLNPDGINPELLTTYAGILFRQLLDEFDGDIASAVGAYNGGPAKPNAHYAAGVYMVAAYARRTLEQAALLSGRSAVGLIERNSVRCLADGQSGNRETRCGG